MVLVDPLSLQRGRPAKYYSITQETSMEQTKPYSENPELHNPFLSQANGIYFRKRI